jgi:HEAT repeat protein
MGIGDLIEKLESSDKTTRYDASDALVAMGTPALPGLIDKLLSYRAEEARGMALWSIGEIVPRYDDARIDREMLAPLIDALRDPSTELRCRGAWALGRLKVGLAVDPLIAALRNDSGEAREAVKDALQYMKDPRGLEALGKLA